MNLLLIIRAEIVCLAILLFILLASRFYNMGKDEGSFIRICLFAIGHVAFDLITVCTVNSADTVPESVNWICHIIFYMFALLFSYEFFCYIISLCYEKKTLLRIRIVGFAPILIYFFAVPFLPMEYLSGNGTNYSFGTTAIVGYGVAMLLFVSSIIVVILNTKKLGKYVAGALLPMLSAAITVELIQIIVPEMLFTGGTVTLITVGFFFSLENPVAVLRQKVLTDALTGVKSRHSYEADILQMDMGFAEGKVYGMAFIDINGLKAVNDSLGHLEGDEYIGCVAQILLKTLKNADSIYRMGGDEFLAVYCNKEQKLIKDELVSINSECERLSLEKPYEVSVAQGLAISDKYQQSLRNVLRMADFRMYANKAIMKQRKSYLMGNTDEINISGLTDRIFDALAITDSNRFLYVTNLTTGVTRWSVSAAEYLGLDSVFVNQCSEVLMNKVHPDNKEAFADEINSIRTGDKDYYESEYKIQNSENEYVNCACYGTFLRGKNEEPDLYAGTMLIREATDSIDQITGLRNYREMNSHFNHLIKNKIPAVIIQISIINLGRINMLYGYNFGDELLKKLSSTLRHSIDNGGDLFCCNGTKFVVCLPGASKEDAINLYRKIKHSAEKQIRLDTITPPLKLAAGAYALREDFSGTASFLQSNLIYAYERSKHYEHGELIFYDGFSDLLLSGDHKNRLISIHKDAIGERVGFYLLYQPIVKASTGKIVGAEALLRWQDDSFGVVNPSSFIPWLEGDPCFNSLGKWLLKKALIEAGQLLAKNPDFVLNVNVAGQQLENSDFGDEVLKILKETGYPASQLCLELTERCRELNSDFLKSQIDFFRRNKIKIALDDFGTGFSSFGLLLNLNVDEIKLDMKFVKDIKNNHSNQVLTKMLIDMSNSMGYSICLEGVEDNELCDYLSSYGATYYQGFYCKRPVSVQELGEHMKKWNENK